MKFYRRILPGLFMFYFGILSIAYGETLQVVSSIFPVTDIALQIGGENVEVTTIVPAGASPHTFEMKPSLIRKFSSARVFLMIGAGLEYWADQMVRSSGRQLKPVVLSEGISLVQSTEEHSDEPTGKKHHHAHPSKHSQSDHESDVGNPHIWLDPQLVKTMVNRIQEAFAVADPIHASSYEYRAKNYLDQLDILDREIAETVKQFTIRQIVSFHSSWDYFINRYGLTLAGVIEKSPGRNPTPRDIADIVSRIRSFHIRAVFAEPQFSPKVAEVIAGEADVKVLILDPLGGETLPARNSYLGLMRYNLQIMKEGMQ